MAKTLTLEQAARVFLWFLFSAALLFFGPRYAERFIFDPSASSTTRYLGIAGSVLCLVPWFGYVAWGLSIADEYHRQTLVAGTAVAFGLSVLFSIATRLMADARLTREVITINLSIGFILWVLGLAITAVYLRIRRGA